MTDPTKSLIVAVLDRSASMAHIKTDTEGGFNTFIDEQRKQPGSALVTLAQFDDQYEIAYENTPIADVPKLELIPRGMTALLDAVGKTITSVGVSLAGMDENDRPATVIMVILTDGYENSSREWNADAVKKLVTEQQEHYGWEFIFLGANLDALNVARGMGIAAGSAMAYTASGAQVTNTMRSVGEYVTTTRGGAKAAFSQSDRDAARGE